MLVMNDDMHTYRLNQRDVLTVCSKYEDVLYQYCMESVYENPMENVTLLDHMTFFLCEHARLNSF